MQTGRRSRPGGAAQGFLSVTIAKEGLARGRPGSQWVTAEAATAEDSDLHRHTGDGGLA